MACVLFFYIFLARETGPTTDMMDDYIDIDDADGKTDTTDASIFGADFDPWLDEHIFETVAPIETETVLVDDDDDSSTHSPSLPRSACSYSPVSAFESDDAKSSGDDEDNSRPAIPKLLFVKSKTS
jgi:hypothetical protein